MYAVLGALTALVIGVYLIAQDDGGLADELGDALDMLTSTEAYRLSRLEPQTRAMVQQLIADSWNEDGIRLTVGQTDRTPAQEKALVAGGKTAASLKVSWHELGRAVDLYPDNRDDPGSLGAYQTFHARAVAMGFRSIAFNADGSKHLIKNSAGKMIWDGGHIEWREPYDTIAQAVQAEGTDEQRARLA